MMANYKLDENAKVFSYTREELFDCITRIVAHPHTSITQHDKARAMAIFLTFADYLGNYTESDNNHGHYVYECDATDFDGYVMEMLDFKDYSEVNVQEILK
jgi:hypothetical protein